MSVAQSDQELAVTIADLEEAVQVVTAAVSMAEKRRLEKVARQKLKTVKSLLSLLKVVTDTCSCPTRQGILQNTWSTYYVRVLAIERELREQLMTPRELELELSRQSSPIPESLSSKFTNASPLDSPDLLHSFSNRSIGAMMPRMSIDIDGGRRTPPPSMAHSPAGITINDEHISKTVVRVHSPLSREPAVWPVSINDEHIGKSVVKIRSPNDQSSESAPESCCRSFFTNRWVILIFVIIMMALCTLTGIEIGRKYFGLNAPQILQLPNTTKLMAAFRS